jgi:hypothetical protein
LLPGGGKPRAFKLGLSSAFVSLLEIHLGRRVKITAPSSITLPNISPFSGEGTCRCTLLFLIMREFVFALFEGK